MFFFFLGGGGESLFLADFQILKKISGNNLPAVTSTSSVGPSGEIDFLTLPDNLTISVFADGLEEPRVIAFDSSGRMLVSETEAGRVVLLEDIDNDGLAEKKTVLHEGLRSPHGLAFYTNPVTKKVYLYVAETHQVLRFEYNVSKGVLIDAAGQNIANLPADGRNLTRSIAFGPNFRKEQIIDGMSDVNTQILTK